MAPGRIEKLSHNQYRIVLEAGRGKDGRRKRIVERFSGSKRKAEQRLLTIQTKILNQGASALDARSDKRLIEQCRIMLKDHPEISIKDCVEYYVKMHPIQRVGLKDMVRLFLDKKSRKNLNDHTTIRWYKLQCDGLFDVFGDLAYEEMDCESLLIKIATLRNKRDGRKLVSPVTMHNKARMLRMVLDSAVKSKWIPENPITQELVKEILPKKDSSGDRTIFTPEEIREFLGHAERKAIFLLPIFTGLRIQTLLNLDWDSHVHREDRVVEIPKQFDKKGKTRYLEGIPGTFWDWVEALDPHGPISEGMTERDFYRYRLSVMETAKLDHHSDNVFRRSFASHAIHVIGLGPTLLLMTHKGDPTTFHEHYYIPTLKRQSVNYFEIPPTIS